MPLTGVLFATLIVVMWGYFMCHYRYYVRGYVILLIIKARQMADVNAVAEQVNTHRFCFVFNDHLHY